MKKVPFVFQNVVRKRYFEILKIFVEDVDLILEIGNYNKDVIVDRNGRIPHTVNKLSIVAIIESHSAWGEPDDLTNEGINRKYDGLKIFIQNEDYRNKIEEIADRMKGNLEEDVTVV